MAEHRHADHNKIKDMLPAVVQIVALKEGFLGNLSSIWTGSGTIVDPRGIILTNCHVANPRAMGMPSPPADKLAIAITERSDEAPVLTYIAEIVVQEPRLDLAILQISARMDGKSVSRLKLPTIPLGDSDEIELGDILSILGYPGIGGETVTFTSGSVSGFSHQKDVTPGRAWIKTDATIAGGNSGGTAVDGNGHLIGVPTQAAAGTGVSPVDARPVVDTNRDGRVDQRDTPMAIGGFINGLRPVNLAKPLLAKAGVKVSGYKSAPRAKVASSASSSSSSGASGKLGKLKSKRSSTKKATVKKPTITNLVFSAGVTKDGRPINATSIIKTGRKQIFASFEFAGMRNRTKWRQVWAIDGKKVYEDETAWEDGPRGRKTLALGSSKGLPDGEYHLVIAVRNEIVAEGQVTVGRRSEDADTEVSGQVIDKESRRGIRDALVIALKAGVRTSDFVEQQKKEMALTSTRTDRNGRFTFPKQLPKGDAYGLVVVARGYRDMAIENALRISPNAPEKAQIYPVPMIQD